MEWVMAISALGSMGAAVLMVIFLLRFRNKDADKEKCTRHQLEYQKLFSDSKTEYTKLFNDLDKDCEKKNDIIWDKINQFNDRYEKQIEMDTTLKNVCRKIDAICEKLNIIQ